MCLGGHLALRAAVSLYHCPLLPSIYLCLDFLPLNHPHHLHPCPPAPQTDQSNYKSQLDPRVSATVCYFATDVHSRTLGPYDKPDLSATAPSPDSTHTIDLLGNLKGEVSLIFGLKDTHVPDAGRDLIRTKLREAGTVFSFHEFAWAQHAFIRDELSKGRYDPAITKACFEVLLELFGRTLKVDLGARDGAPQKLEHVC